MKCTWSVIQVEWNSGAIWRVDVLKTFLGEGEVAFCRARDWANAVFKETVKTLKGKPNVIGVDEVVRTIKFRDEGMRRSITVSRGPVVEKI